MTTMSIADSVKDSLVVIVKADNLRLAIARRTGDLNKHSRENIDDARWPGKAEKLAVKCGLRLEASCAETDTPEAHKAALVARHEETHDCKPGFRRPDTGEHAPGVQRVNSRHDENWSALDWSPWKDLLTFPKGAAPETPGVIRIRAVST